MFRPWLSRLAGDADARQKGGVLGIVIEGIVTCIRTRASVGALFESLRHEQHTAARAAPVMDDHVMVASEADFENAIGNFAAKTSQRKRAIAHVYVYPTY